MEPNLSTVVELVNNIQYIAAAYNQLWTIRTSEDESTIAFIDERTGQEKMVFHNPDDAMVQLIAEIQQDGWMQVKQKYLSGDGFCDSRVRLEETE